jgi:uncharacterized protein VirK/YbjX
MMLYGTMIELSRILRAAREMDGGPTFKAKFLASWLANREVLAPLLNPPKGSLLHNHLHDRPEVLGVVLWPYQCSAWSVDERVQRIVGHFEALERAPTVFHFGVEDKLQILELSDFRDGAKLILDQPRWLAREGHLALNLFNGDHRSYSLSFSLYGNTAFIAGLQGRSTPMALDLYRDMTKDFHGLRPRDLILDLFRIVAPVLGVEVIHSVADGYRLFRHPFFGDGKAASLATNYDEIWKDRGGTQVSKTHFELPAQAVRRSLEEISSKKRGMYRKRYDMLDELEQRFQRHYTESSLLRFDAK